jgi:hypothetical protein
MVELLGGLMLLLGIGLVLVGYVYFLVVAFSESILWGLGVLFVPVVPLVFLIVNWSVAKRPFFWQLWGLVFMLAAVFLFSGHEWLHHHLHG